MGLVSIGTGPRRHVADSAELDYKLYSFFTSDRHPPPPMLARAHTHIFCHALSPPAGKTILSSFLHVPSVWRISYRSTNTRLPANEPIRHVTLIRMQYEADLLTVRSILKGTT